MEAMQAREEDRQNENKQTTAKREGERASKIQKGSKGCQKSVGAGWRNHDTEKEVKQL